MEFLYNYTGVAEGNNNCVYGFSVPGRFSVSSTEKFGASGPFKLPKTVLFSRRKFEGVSGCSFPVAQ